MDQPRILVYCEGGRSGEKFHERRGRLPLYRFERRTPFAAPAVHEQVTYWDGEAEHAGQAVPPRDFWTAEPFRSKRDGKRQEWWWGHADDAPGARPPAGRTRPPAITYLKDDTVVEDQEKVARLLQMSSNAFSTSGPRPGRIDTQKMLESLDELTARAHVDIRCPCGLKVSERGPKVFAILDVLVAAGVDEISLAALIARVRHARGS